MNTNGIALDAEQLALDLEDMHKRHDALQAALRARDDAEAEVARAKRDLAQAKRKAKEAGYHLASLLNRERAKR